MATGYPLPLMRRTRGAVVAVLLLATLGLALNRLVGRPSLPRGPFAAHRPSRLVKPRGVIPHESKYPRGAFEWCPDVASTRPLTRGDEAAAGRAALAFDVALHGSSQDAIRRLVDPTIALRTDPSLPDASRAVLDPLRWRRTTTASHLSLTTYTKAPGVGGNGPASADLLVSFGCGQRVAARTWQVAVKDAGFTSSREAVFFLVHRANGWRVWGSY
jgi:hypothetical protein